MFWDRISGLYDLFENIYNGKNYKALGVKVARYIDKTDLVLECACGTGAITRHLAPACKGLIATDFSVGMLRQTGKKCRDFSNVKLRRVDMTAMKWKDESFDKVVAGNVIHLLDDPEAAVKELYRVCRKGGRVIIPTYINRSSKSAGLMAGIIGRLGADFKRQFDLESYKRFFAEAGYADTEFFVIEGRMPCAVAVITKPQ